MVPTMQQTLGRKLIVEKRPGVSGNIGIKAAGRSAPAGSASQNRLEMALFTAQQGLRIVHIPYRGGAGPAVTNLWLATSA